jgi:hypothetical protein
MRSEPRTVHCAHSLRGGDKSRPTLVLVWADVESTWHSLFYAAGRVGTLRQ